MQRTTSFEMIEENALGGARTPNPRFRRPMLYPIELRVLAVASVRRGGGIVPLCCACANTALSCKSDASRTVIQYKPFEKTKPGKRRGRDCPRRGTKAHEKCPFQSENKSLLRDPSCALVGNFDFELNGVSYSRSYIAFHHREGLGKPHSSARESAATSGSSPGQRPPFRRWAWASSWAINQCTKFGDRCRSVRLRTMHRDAPEGPGIFTGTCITTPGPGS